MILKFIKSFFIIFSNVFNSLGIRGIQRLCSVTTFAIRLTFYVWLDRKEINKETFLFTICSKIDPLLNILKDERDAQRAKWILEQIVKQGTTFIKLGQILSTRADLIPLVYMKELAKLQDDIPPFDKDLAFESICEELGRPVDSIFEEIGYYPLASASLGQVYKAKLRYLKKDVVIKIQRPNLKKQISNDVFILKILAKEAEKYPEITRGNDYCALLDEFMRVINDEIDYIKEGKHCDLFREKFKNHHNIYVPKVYWQYTTKQIIVLEYIEGFKVTEKEKIINAGLNTKEITKEGCNAYLKQLLTDGFFHADPHPGNLRIMSDGKLAFFDFGMVGYVSKELQIKLINAILHLISKDYRKVVDDFVLMGLLDKDCKDLDQIAKDLEPIYNARFSDDGNITVTFKQIIEDLASIVYKYPFKVPIEFALIIRALLILEGVGHSLDPSFNVIKALKPFVQRYVFTQEGQWLKELVINEILNEGIIFRGVKTLILNSGIDLIPGSYSSYAKPIKRIVKYLISKLAS